MTLAKYAKTAKEESSNQKLRWYDAGHQYIKIRCLALRRAKESNNSRRDAETQSNAVLGFCRSILRSAISAVSAVNFLIRKKGRINHRDRGGRRVEGIDSATISELIHFFLGVLCVQHVNCCIDSAARLATFAYIFSGTCAHRANHVTSITR
jgi:hypothetical protein